MISQKLPPELTRTETNLPTTYPNMLNCYQIIRKPQKYRRTRQDRQTPNSIYLERLKRQTKQLPARSVQSIVKVKNQTDFMLDPT